MHEMIPTMFDVLDERFVGTRGDRMIERAYAEGRWLEGPAYDPAGRFVLFSDIPNDRVLRYDEVTGRTDVFTHPAGFANGRTLDRQGRFISCEHGERRVTRLEHDGSVRVLADAYRGEQLNSPNDVVEHSDGSIWFTDPTYGITSDYEGHAAEPELDSRNVYRLDPAAGSLTVVSQAFNQPNGLAFSPTETELYVVDSAEHEIHVFDVEGDRLGDARLFAADPRGYDGIRFDHHGRLWCAADDGLHCYHLDGTLLGRLLLPEITSNLTFGGRQRNQLYITATTSFYTLRVNFRAARYPG
ncbi:MAG TPA: SMP-30/gluconolactonase/LRE family protein [Propionibacteriaceae bacterium]